jgi:hypothetical protein
MDTTFAVNVDSGLPSCCSTATPATGAYTFTSLAVPRPRFVMAITLYELVRQRMSPP